MSGYNFTDRLRRVLQMAREEAARLHHAYVGTEHVLLGLVREGGGLAAAALTHLGVDPGEIGRKVEATVKKGATAAAAGPDLPYTSRAKKVLELAMMEARELEHSHVGTEHLLLGLLREEKGIAAQVLVHSGVTPGRVTAALGAVASLRGGGMPSTQAAVVLGASGSVGHALVTELIRGRAFNPIMTLVRRSEPDQVAMARDAGVELRETFVPAMDPAGLETATIGAIRSVDGAVAGFSVLGIGAGTAKLTIDEHRAVDVQLNAAFARALKASGRVKHLAFMSAVGADPAAAASGSGAAGMARYARVKGEAEAAVKEDGPDVVSIFRPAMIIGSRHTPWLLEKLLPAISFLMPAKYRSITVEQIAKAMIAASINPPPKSGVYHYPEMIALNG